MTVHVLSAGDGYEYLTRQVASGDTAREGQHLSAYYAESGYPPGRWLGQGLAGIDDGRRLTGLVDTEQMKRLFGTGSDPVSEQPLGQRYRIPPSLDERVAARVAALPAEMTDTDKEARVEAIRVEESARRMPRPVAGFDCVFTPVKSVSVLWALGDSQTREQVLAAHHAAVEQTLAYMEREVARTRVGAAGIAQVDVRGLVAAAFDHWDARPVRDPDGVHTDPNLHTHLVIANRVQGPDGRWRTLDSKALHQSVVACSERYNTLVADELTRRLGVTFVDRQVRRDRQPVREIAGVSDALIREFSSRRAQVETNLRGLILKFRDEHGREPTTAEQIRLAQTATLKDRAAKTADHPSLAGLLDSWQRRARVIDRKSVDAIRRVSGRRNTIRRASDLPDHQLHELADAALAAVAAKRATWTRWHVEAEVTRQTSRWTMASPAERDVLISTVTDRALASAVCLQPPSSVTEPGALRRADGESVFAPHNSARYSSRAILDAETRLIAAGHRLGAPAVDPVLVAAVVEHTEATSQRTLSTDQAHAVRHIATSGRAIDLLIGPAGTGKTTTMRMLSAVWQAQHGPGSVLLLAPTAAAARVLSDAVRERGDNLSKWLYETSGPGGQRRRDRVAYGDRSPDLLAEEGRWQLSPGQLVIVDEACLAGTLALDELRAQTEAAGAKLLLVGDQAQLPAVEAGGALRLLANDCGAVELTSVWRFSEAWEAAASLELRRGATAALDAYDRHGRVVGGCDAAMVDAGYLRWLADERDGSVSLLLAADNATVAGLNARARTERIASGEAEADGIRLHDGTTVGVGDRIVTRRNDRSLLLHAGRDFVKNGDLWRVEARHADGTLVVRHARHHGQVHLPARYVQTHVELGYATTTHRAQGMTVDTAHLVADELLTRELLYVGMTRGVRANTAYVVTETTLDPGLDRPPAEPTTARDVLTAIVHRVGAEQSATETLRTRHADEESLATLMARYEYTRGVLGQVRAPAQADARESRPSVRSQPDRTRLIAGLVPAAEVAPDTGLARYFDDLGRRISARASELAERAVREQPAWMRALGPAPDRPLERLRYNAAVATVAAYRDIHRMADPNPIEASRPHDPQRGEAWSRAQRALLYARRLTRHQPAAPSLATEPARGVDRALSR